MCLWLYSGQVCIVAGYRPPEVQYYCLDCSPGAEIEISPECALY